MSAATKIPIEEEMDGFLVTRDVIALVRCSKRKLYRMIEANEFPAPDVAGRVGAPRANSTHRWRRSTVRRALDEMQRGSRQ